MIISINKNDIYRPTTEKIIPEKTDAFFSESYNRAFRLVKNFEYALENNKDRNRSIKNIIMISSDRGQGKTTALYSIKDFLCDGDIYNEEEKKNNRLHRKEQGIYRKYIPMGAVIDPSSLNENEPLIRTVLSYLYNDFSRLVETLDNDQKYKYEIREAKECFSNCYKYIDLIYGKRVNTDLYYDDDLENLSALGNSLNFRKSLEKLINKYLSLYKKIMREDETAASILVISIDDVDLAIGRAFDVCEAIRNYLSCSNILVLMAADVDQLENAIEQDYIGKYENLLKNQVAKIDKSMYLSKCREMSTRYIEKVFPRGCRIDLPTIDGAIANGVNIELDLGELFGDEKLGMQALLLRKIYERTGIMFFLDENNRNPILPSTMRELTHFVKMLDDMETVNLSDTLERIINLKASERDNAFMVEIDKELRNIRILKAQFLGYWIPIHLSERYQALIEDVADLSIDNYAKELKKRIKKENDLKIEAESKEQTFANFVILNENAISGISTSSENAPTKEITNEIINALRISYTLSANEWFLMALKDNNFDKLRRLIGHPFYLKHNNVKYAKKYHFFSYVCNKEDLELYYHDGDMIDGDTIEWLKSYCDIRQEEDDYPDYFGDSLEQCVWDYDRLKEIRVNVFDIILNMLDQSVSAPTRNDEVSDRNVISEEGNITEQADIMVNTSEIDNLRFVSLKPYLEVRDILVNSDVQRCVTSVIDEKLRNFGLRRKIKNLEDVYNEMANAIENAIKEQDAFFDADYSSVKKALINGLSIANRFILINSDNAENFADDLIDKIVLFLEEEIGKLKEINEPKHMTNYSAKTHSVSTIFQNNILYEIYDIYKKQDINNMDVQNVNIDEWKIGDKLNGKKDKVSIRQNLVHAIAFKTYVEKKIKLLISRQNDIDYTNDDNQIKELVMEFTKIKERLSR